MKKILILLASFLLISTLFMVNTPIKAAAGDITLVQWDTVATGISNGTVDNVTIHKQSGSSANTGTVMDDYVFSSPNSFYVSGGTAPGNIDGVSWINLTNDYSYISSVTMHLKTYNYGDGALFIYFYFYNNGTEVLRIRMGEATNDMYYWGTDSAYHKIVDITQNAWVSFNLTVSHITLNQMNYTVDGGYVAGVDGTSALPIIDWNTFDSIKVFVTGTSSSLTHAVYIDDIIINTLVGGTGTSCTCCGMTEFPSYEKTQNTLNYYYLANDRYVEVKYDSLYTGNITTVVLPISINQYDQVSHTLSDYTCFINDIPLGYPSRIIDYQNDYALVWDGFNMVFSNEPVVFEFGCDAFVTYDVDKLDYVLLWWEWWSTQHINYYWYGIGITTYDNPVIDSRTHNSSSLYGNGNIDGVSLLQDIYMLFCTPSNETTWIDTYHSGIRDNFIEFRDYAKGCRYAINDNLYYVAYLNSTNMTSNYATIRVMRTLNNNTVIFHTFTLSAFDEIILDGIYYPPITEYGVYQMFMYDGSDFSTSIHTSIPITICEKHELPVPPDDDTNFFGFTLPSWVTIIIGVVIALIITMIPLIIAIVTHSSQEIPALLYLGFFFLGMCISVLLGLMSIIIPFIVLFGLIIGFAIMWLRGQSSG